MPEQQLVEAHTPRKGSGRGNSCRNTEAAPGRVTIVEEPPQHQNHVDGADEQHLHLLE